jgi:PAS domain S-box-containing protein
MKDKQTSGSWRTAWECLLAIMAMAVLTLVSFRLHAGPAMAALLYFFLAILISLWAGFLPTAFACAVAALCFVYFFTQPLYHLWMSEPVEIATTMAFSGTALIISRLISRVRERTAEVQKTNEQLQAEIAERQRAEEKTQQSEAELRRLVDAIPQHVVVVKTDGSFLYVNQVALEYTGLTLEDSLSKDSLAKIFHPDDVEKVVAERQQAISRGLPWHAEVRIRGKDGNYRWFMIRLNPLRDEQGRILRWYGTRTDIEDRKRAEEALHRLNRELRAISECNQTLMRATDEQTLLREICHIVCEEAGYRMAWVAYAEHDAAKSVRPVAWTGAEEGYLANLGITWADTERGWTPTGTAIRSGKPCCIQDFATDPRLAPWRKSVLQHGFLSGIALPLKDEHGSAFGSLSIYSAQPNAFTSEEIHLLEELAADLAFGIVTLRSRAARERAEQEVALLSFALDNVREAAFLIDDRGRFQYVNEEACRAVGYTRAELLGLGVTDIDPEFPAERWSDHWRDLQAQRSLSFESRHRTRDGHTFPVEVSANYLEYGDRAYNLALVRDITERKRAEEALRRSEAYLASAQKLTRTGTYAMNGTSREPIYWSEEMFRLFGTDRKEGLLTRDQVWQRIHPEDHDKVKESSDRVFLEKVDSEVEYRIVLPDGTVKVVHTLAHPVLSANGEVAEVVATMVDITERKRAEEALRAQAALLDLTHDTVFVMDMEGVIKYWNRGAEERYGWTAEHALGRVVHDLLKTVFPGPLEEIRAEVSRTGRWEGEILHTKRDGTQVVVASRWALQRGERGAPLAILETNNDITLRKRAEEALRLSNAYNRSLIEASPDPLVTIGPDGKITDVNAATEAATGRSRGELVGTDFCDYFTEPAKARAGYEQVFREGMVRDYPLELRHRDGGVMSVLYNASVYRDESGRVTGVFAAARDVTERQRAEEALRESETRFRTFVDHAADALFIYDFEQGTIVDVNRQACESLGYTRQELIGTMGLAFDQNVDRAVTESMAERTAAGETVIDTHWHQRKDGTLFPVEVHTSQYWYGGRRFLLKVARDITDRKRAEEELRRSEAYLAEGQRLSHTGSWAFDVASNKYIYVSEENFRIFEMDAQEGLPNREAISRQIHPEDWDRVNESLEKSLREKVDTSSEFRIVLPGGTVKHLQVIRHPVLNDAGDVVELVGTLIDMTERKRAEQERERLRQLEADLAHLDRVSMMGELAASIAHEVNQPLSGVVVNANACLRWLAGDSPNLEEARETVRRIVRDGKRAGEVIARIRALATKTATAKERLNMNEAIREVVAFAQDEVRRNRVSLRIELADDLSPVWGDRVQLQQVVLNLVMNGIEAMSRVEERPRELIIRTQNDDAGQVQVTVQDSGTGLDPQSRERMFEAFYTTKHGGMGMGLSISRSIIQNHGGRLWAVANEGPGISLQFTITKYQQ